MTEFEKLSQIYMSERNEWWNYKTDCAKFAGAALRKIKETLGFPEDCIEFVRVDEDGQVLGNDSIRYSPIGVQTFEDDGFCQFPIKLVLHLGQVNQFPRHASVLAFRVQKQADGAFLVKLTPNGTAVSVRQDADDQMTEMVMRVRDLLQEEHTDTLQKFISERRSGRKPIGFAVQNMVTEPEKR